GFLFAETDAEARLEEKLLLGKKALIDEMKGKRLPSLVIFDHRRHVAKSLPRPTDNPNPGSCFFIQTNTAKRSDNSGVAKGLRSRFEEFVWVGERITRILENRPVLVEVDGRLPVMVGVVLVNQEVDYGFPEGKIIGRRVLTAKRGCVH